MGRRSGGEAERVDEDADEASVLQLRQQLLDEWPEGERRDTVLEAIDRLLLERRERQRDGSLGPTGRVIPHR